MRVHACKYVHAVQKYIVQIRNEFYIIDRFIYASTRRERERERQRERGRERYDDHDDSRSK